MGALAPIVPYAALALTAADAIAGEVQASRQTAAENKAARAEAESHAAQVALARRIEQRRQAEALKRAQAARRARFGAAGISGRSGSAEAVLAGLASESARRDAEAGATANLDIASTDRSVAMGNRLNLLRAARRRTHTVLGLGGTLLARYPWPTEQKKGPKK